MITEAWAAALTAAGVLALTCALISLCIHMTRKPPMATWRELEKRRRSPAMNNAISKDWVRTHRLAER